MARSIEYGNRTIRFETLFLSSRKTLAIEVHPDRRVLVRAPSDCPEKVVAERVRRRAAWILREIDRFRQYEPRVTARRYVSGETHRFLGRQYRLRVTLGNQSAVRLTRGRIEVTITRNRNPERVRRVLDAWCRERAREVFRDVLAKLLRSSRSISPPRIIVRALRSRWGSMSARGTMTLNVVLVQAPRSCIEYVVAHELCHRAQPHHGKDFYELLLRIMPDWQARKRRLETFAA